ncbi:hypothetical protein MSAN_02303000 [Mycena sanguinolenta]|uniref:Uncharacterized protein n=1 Tax=Mycena sanguinolenta TaxID=230812 RepID=A0A8H6X8E3_9AGAR|nr:hypothetical protein MSAN_02303000 [Mycena sanguinolenta]
MRISAISNEIKSFRLGYTEEQPYPWRWTTPVVSCAFLLISPFLALVNVPLSAYNIIQEFTYNPNGTLPAVFLANIVPSVLQNPTDSFTPQLLNVGETIALDNYIFNYTISQAFNGVNPVSAFPYYNNPLSDSCDVANITMQLLLSNDPVWGWNPQIQVGGTVACYLPTPFYLTWGGWPERGGKDSFRSIPGWVSDDIIGIFGSWNGLLDGPEPDMGMNLTQAGISITVQPCCKCEAVLAGGPLESAASLFEPPCSSNPAQFVGVDFQIADLWAGTSLGNLSISALSTAYGNLIQTLYHIVRLDLGVILGNQIYNSPEMFNRTISPLDLDLEILEGSWTNAARGLTSNAILMAQWQQDVKFFQNNTRVPPLEYLQSVPRLKPLGSAVTSVFVSTFAMLSVMWTVFSLVAGALARHSGRDDTLGKKDTVGQTRTWDKRLESGVEEIDETEVILLVPRKEPDALERLRQEGMQMQVSLARMRAAMIKHGIMQDEDWVQDDDTTAG